ncbi:MAG: hypothetical protein AAF517_09805, partial [Planctomycetota bacterium]
AFVNPLQVPRVVDKGTFSNLASAGTLVTSYFLPESEARSVLLSAGMFAFSGGVTNSLAVKMLFDRVPGLIGSGVIQNRFKEIRQEIKDLILTQFFSEGDLRQFLEANKDSLDLSRYVKTDGDNNPVRQFVEQNWERFASAETLKPVISNQVDKLFQSPVGSLLQMVGRGSLENLAEGFVTSFAEEMKGRVLEASENIDVSGSAIELDVDQVVNDLRVKVDDLLEQRLAKLEPSDVKQMMEDVIRNHLGWLVVWGNVFGGLLGIGAYFVK